MMLGNMLPVELCSRIRDYRSSVAPHRVDSLVQHIFGGPDAALEIDLRRENSVDRFFHAGEKRSEIAPPGAHR